MQIKEIEELIQIIERSAIEEFELERAGVRIRVKKSASGQATVDAAPVAAAAAPGTVTTEASAPSPESAGTQVFVAPIVGTFYLSPKPDAEPFIKVGDRVSKGTVVCIIEAMKIFNQIECDMEGEVVRILAENGQPVEYGEALFEIRPDS